MRMLANLPSTKGVMMNAEQLIRFASGPARTIFEHAGSIQYPVFHFIREDSSHSVFSIPPVIADDKDEWARYAKGILIAEKAVAYAMINEAWQLHVASTTREEFDRIFKHADEHGLKNHPDRQEVVAITAEDQIGSARGYMPINRTVLNTKPTLGDLQMVPMVEGETVESRFLGLLPPCTKPKN